MTQPTSPNTLSHVSAEQTKKITIRHTSPEDTRAIVKFHKNEGLSNWQQEFHGFRPDDGVLFLAEYDGELVGTQGLIPYEMNINGTPKLCLRSERTLVAPEMRGHGLFARLYDQCKAFGRNRESQFIFGSTGAGRAFERVGFRVETNYSRHYIGLVSFTSILRHLRHGGFEHRLSISRLLRAIRNREKQTLFEYVKLAMAIPSSLLQLMRPALRRRAKSPVDISESLRSKSDIEALFEQIRGNDQLIYMHRTPRFQRWQNPMIGTARTFFAYEADELAGYITLQADESRATATVMDLAASNPTASDALIDVARRHARKTGNAFLKVSFNDRCPALEVWKQTNLRAGLLPVYRGGSEVLLPLADNIDPAFHDIRAYYITDIWHVLGE